MIANNADIPANLALLLLDKTGTVLGRHQARMTAAEQRALFGRVIGRGTIIIDGDNETVTNRVKVAFGMDYDDRAQVTWRELAEAQ